MRLKELKHILMTNNTINTIRVLIFAPFRYIKYLIDTETSKKGYKNKKGLNPTEVYTITQANTSKNSNILFVFFRKRQKPALNTATVYINGSDPKFVSTASAYDLHTMLVPFCKQHSRRNTRRHN